MNLSPDRLDRYMEKLDHLNKYHGLLSKWLSTPSGEDMGENEYYRNQFSIYHSAQLVAEVISDISAMIVKDLGYAVGDNYKNFSTLHDNGIIDDSDVLTINELNGLRNRLAHDYNGIIDTMALDSIKKNIDIAITFKEKVEKWLKQA